MKSKDNKTDNRIYLFIYNTSLLSSSYTKHQLLNCFSVLHAHLGCTSMSLQPQWLEDETWMSFQLVDEQCDQTNDGNEPAEIELKDHLVKHRSSELEVRGYLHQYLEYTDEII